MAYFDSMKNSSQYYYNDIEQVHNLINQDADYKLKDDEGSSILHYAVDALGKTNDIEPQYYSQIIEIIDMLVKKGAEINARNKKGMTPLAIAFSYYYSIKEVKIRLIELMQKIDIRANDGSTALMYVTENERSTEIIEVLIKKGADVNAKDNAGNTPLIRACLSRYKYPEIIKYLIRKGAKLNAQNDEGETALIACFKSMNERGDEVLKEVVQLLLKAGADPEIRDLCGLNAKDIAVWTENEFVFNTENALSD